MKKQNNTKSEKELPMEDLEKVCGGSIQRIQDADIVIKEANIGEELNLGNWDVSSVQNMRV